MRAQTFDNLLIEALPRLRRFAFKLAGNAADADDLVNDTAERALRNRDSFIEGGNFAAWASTLLRNRFIDLARRRRFDGGGIDDLPSALVQFGPTQHGAAMLADAVRALDELPRPHIDLLLAAADGESYEEMAERAGVPLGTIRSRLSRAREELQRAVDGVEARL